MTDIFILFGKQRAEYQGDQYSYRDPKEARQELPADGTLCSGPAARGGVDRQPAHCLEEPFADSSLRICRAFQVPLEQNDTPHFGGNGTWHLRAGRHTGLGRIHSTHPSRLLGLRGRHSAPAKASVSLLSRRPSDCGPRTESE